MSRIVEILHMQNKGSYALINVLMDDGTEAVVFCGGDCEVYFNKGRVSAFVKKGKSDESKDI